MAAKKIKFPLRMQNGVLVRNLEAFRLNFTIEKAMEHYFSGRLQTWLKERYYDEEWEELSQLDKDSEEFLKNFCHIFGVPIHHDSIGTIDVCELERQCEKRNIVKNATEDERIITNYNQVALNQEELLGLIKAGEKQIFLLGGEFVIPTGENDVTYTGINEPLISFDVEKDWDFDNKNIIFNEVKMKANKPISIKIRNSKNISVVGESLSYQLKLKDKVFSYNYKTVEDESSNRGLSDAIEASHFEPGVYLYNEKLIITDRNCLFVFDMKNGVGKQLLSDFKPAPLKSYKGHSIKASYLYSHFLILQWGKSENSALQVIDLDTLSVISTKYMNDPCNPVIKVLKNKVKVYEGMNGVYLDSFDNNVICTDYSFPELEYLNRSSVYVEEDYNGVAAYGYAYKGDVYKYSNALRRLISTNKDFECEGFYQEPQDDMWEDNVPRDIGQFVMVKDKVVARGSDANYHSKSYNSIAELTELVVLNTKGGTPIRRIKGFNHPIDGLDYQDEYVIIWSNEEKMVRILDDTDFDLIQSLKIDDTSGNSIRSIFLDKETRRLVILQDYSIEVYA